jgi:glycosyltransferase involved in cell wall biosynthesis
MAAHVLFITNFCPPYRVRTFETLAQRMDVEFLFLSKGDEWYWERRLGSHVGAFMSRRVKGFRLAGLLINPGLPSILREVEHDVYVKDINAPISVLMTLAAAKLQGKPFVLWTGMWRHPRTLFHLLTYPATRLVYRWADAIVVYGDHVKRYLMSLGVEAEKIFVAPHAVDNEAYNRAVPETETRALRERLDLGHRRVILYVGRLVPEKGLEILLAAFGALKVPDAVLIIAGEGRLRRRLEARARRLGIAARTRFVGYVPPDETVALYALAEVFVLPSVTVRAGREPWGLVVNEAMNQGIPIIASSAVGAAAGGLVQREVTGEVVPERDPDSLRRAMQRVLLDGSYRARLSAGTRVVIGAWDNARMTDGFLAAVAFAARPRAYRR